jgi:hypothetical protein
MNKLVILESKRQHKNTLFTLHFNFNKLEVLLLLALTLAMKPPWKKNLPWEVQSFTQGTWGSPSPNACDYHS